MGGANAALMVGGSLDATGESLTESPISPDFTRASIPAEPDGTDIESEHDGGSRASSVSNPFTLSLGVKEAVSGVPPERMTYKCGCVAHPHTCVTFNVEN